MNIMYRRIKIESELSNLIKVENAIDNATVQLGVSQDNYGKILVSTLEAVNNAILHGNRSDPDKFVRIVIAYDSNELKIKVTDEGQGFNPDSVRDPTLPENIEEPNGRGVFLMARLADKIKYSKKGNTVTMIFKNVIS
jgi:serine/threonine-protein kinase RsbW